MIMERSILIKQIKQKLNVISVEILKQLSISPSTLFTDIIEGVLIEQLKGLNLINVQEEYINENDEYNVSIH